MPEKLVDDVIKYLRKENGETNKRTDLKTYKEKRRYLNEIINTRPPYPLEDKVLENEDKLLEWEKHQNKLWDELEYNEKIVVCTNDITNLKIEAIVNSASPKFLGCFIPNHPCLDNQIHLKAGMRLRIECYQQMLLKPTDAVIGDTLLTMGYNLPCKYIIHVVVPYIYKEIKQKQIEELKTSYFSCLEMARTHNIRKIAFPSLATGTHQFPQEEANKIAIQTIQNYLEQYPNSFDKVFLVMHSKEKQEKMEKESKNHIVLDK